MPKRKRDHRHGLISVRSATVLLAATLSSILTAALSVASGASHAQAILAAGAALGAGVKIINDIVE
jgi:hypothetical protein